LKSKRKTISIQVHQDGRVEVRAPLQMSKKSIDAVVKEKEIWIEQKLKEYSALREETAKRIQERTLPYLGVWYPICVSDSKFSFSGNVWNLPSENMKEAADTLLQQLAGAYIRPRTRFFAEKYGFCFSGIRITGARTRFGSCSGKNSLNFTRYLIMYTPEMIDYVILHELCHTVYHDHSPAFYALLERVCPKYFALREEMRRSVFLGDLINML